MSRIGAIINYWGAQIPPQPPGTTIYYYVQAQAAAGKTQVRPLPAPSGYWKFRVLQTVGVVENISQSFQLLPAFPNPSKGITCIPVNNFSSYFANAALYDVTGRKVKNIFEGLLPAGERKLFVDTYDLSLGVYTIKIETVESVYTQKLIVR